MSPRYKSPMSTGYRKPITVYDTDPRAKRKRELEKYRASIGSEVIVEKAPIDNIVLEEYPIPYWQLNGTSFWDQKYINLADGYGEFGTAWYSEIYKVPFEVIFNYTINSVGSGINAYGDGLTLSMISDSTPQTLLGTGGGTLGVFNTDSYVSGIAFDPYLNGYYDPTVPFVAAFNTNSYAVYDGYKYPLYNQNTLLSYSNDFLGSHTAKVIFKSNETKIYIDNNLKLITTDLNNKFPSNKIKIGFSGSNGQAVASYKIKLVSAKNL